MISLDFRWMENEDKKDPLKEIAMKYPGFTLLLAAMIASGCATAPQSLSESYPKGYPLLLQESPECGHAGEAIQKACAVAAEIYQQTDPRTATSMFIEYWGKTVWNPEDLSRLMFESVQTMKNIVVPALVHIYHESPGEYSTVMTRELNGAILDSLTSYEHFMETHSNLAAGPPGV
jgi:hypothetical protein